MNFWNTLLNYVLRREAARAAGASAKDANKAAAVTVAIEEIAKKAEEQKK